jgi:hypothetical protein
LKLVAGDQRSGLFASSVSKKKQSYVTLTSVVNIIYLLSHFLWENKLERLSAQLFSA